MTDTRWRYRMITVGASSFDQQAARLSEDGWELINCWEAPGMSVAGVIRMVFKRALDPGEDERLTRGREQILEALGRAKKPILRSELLSMTRMDVIRLDWVLDALVQSGEVQLLIDTNAGNGPIRRYYQGSVDVSGGVG